MHCASAPFAAAFNVPQQAHNPSSPPSRPQQPHNSPLQSPPATYFNAHHGRRWSEAQRTDNTRVQSSISSGESGSSGLSNVKRLSTQQTYWQASSLEDGYGSGNFEKQSPTIWSPSPPLRKASPQSPASGEMVEDSSAVIRYLQEQQRTKEEFEDEDSHALWVLFWLSALDPIHSFIGALYTLLIVVTLILVSPLRLCQTQSSFGDQLIRILAPIFRHHLRMMYAPSVDNAFTFDFKPFSLVLVHLSAPFLSMGIMLAAWVTAAFWLFTFIMGNPDGTERGDDGADAVLSVRNWWEKYLLNAIRQ